MPSLCHTHNFQASLVTSNCILDVKARQSRDMLYFHLLAFLAFWGFGLPVALLSWALSYPEMPRNVSIMESS